ncbi:50S ribosomal protein L3 [Candidatus Kaiserbacteria bacterium RIFOXYD1_FULL_42_15]|uniref:50S ribosomal protein L3 n=2 Tax=Candidatus Kaiseribacteriota TaxID=1752734 RepID=A0A1F6FQB4_9BACT|nr:MAG: 50S ribosomal protein L3 [Candidatus Kaiserbacteria bacterium RIFOXYD1_FULL_42_15]
MKFILGTKDRMTQVFAADGTCYPATILRVAPATVARIKSVATDGYSAIQIASGSQKPERVAKAQNGQFATSPAVVREFRPKAIYNENVSGFELGAVLDASVFTPGDTVSVSSISKGKGFQGVVKRHGFAGGRRSHGNKHSEREPGSIGATGLNRVMKGMRMAGRMGGDRITVKNLTVLQVNAAENVLLIKGAIPGRKGTLVEVRGV